MRVPVPAIIPEITTYTTSTPMRAILQPGNGSRYDMIITPLPKGRLVSFLSFNRCVLIPYGMEDIHPTYLDEKLGARGGLTYGDCEALSAWFAKNLAKFDDISAATP